MIELTRENWEADLTKSSIYPPASKSVARIIKGMLAQVIEAHFNPEVKGPAISTSRFCALQLNMGGFITIDGKTLALGLAKDEDRLVLVEPTPPDFRRIEHREFGPNKRRLARISLV